MSEGNETPLSGWKPIDLPEEVDKSQAPDVIDTETGKPVKGVIGSWKPIPEGDATGKSEPVKDLTTGEFVEGTKSPVSGWKDGVEPPTRAK